MATPNDISTMSIHLRTRVNGRRFDETVPGFIPMSLTAVGDHAVLAFARRDANYRDSLWVRTR